MALGDPGAQLFELEDERSEAHVILVLEVLFLKKRSNEPGAGAVQPGQVAAPQAAFGSK